MTKKQKQEVMIYLTSEQWSPDQISEPVKLITEGFLEHNTSEDEWVVYYDESEATGMAGTRTTVTLFNDGRVRLTRQGTVPMDMVFSEGLQHVSQMSTEYGTFDINISTHEVRGQLNEDGGRIHLGYSLNFSFQDCVSTKLDMVVEPCRKIPPSNLH